MPGAVEVKELAPAVETQRQVCFHSLLMLYVYSFDDFGFDKQGCSLNGIDAACGCMPCVCTCVCASSRCDNRGENIGESCNKNKEKGIEKNIRVENGKKKYGTQAVAHGNHPGYPLGR